MAQNSNNNFSVAVISGPCWNSRYTGNSRTKRGLGKVAQNEHLSKLLVRNYSLIKVVSFFVRELPENPDKRDDQECKYEQDFIFMAHSFLHTCLLNNTNCSSRVPAPTKIHKITQDLYN